MVNIAPNSQRLQKASHSFLNERKYYFLQVSTTTGRVSPEQFHNPGQYFGNQLFPILRLPTSLLSLAFHCSFAIRQLSHCCSFENRPVLWCTYTIELSCKLSLWAADRGGGNEEQMFCRLFCFSTSDKRHNAFCFHLRSHYLLHSLHLWE